MGPYDAMNRTPYAEYFVGGPWNGQDKLSRPEVKHMSMNAGGIEYMLSVGGEILPGDLQQPLERGVYYFRRMTILGELLHVWVHEKETDSTAVIKLLGILLEPHKR